MRRQWTTPGRLQRALMSIYRKFTIRRTCLLKFGSRLQVSDEAIKETMREFMIWEPYETMGKIRNNVQSGNLGYLPLGAKDLTWQTAKLIGLANRTFYNTRAKTLEESLSLKSRPSGYDELAQLVMRGQLLQIDHVYELCERLWTGLNAWYEK